MNRGFNQKMINLGKRFQPEQEKQTNRQTLKKEKNSMRMRLPSHVFYPSFLLLCVVFCFVWFFF